MHGAPDVWIRVLSASGGLNLVLLLQRVAKSISAGGNKHGRLEHVIALIHDLTLIVFGLGHFKRKGLQIRHLRNLLTVALIQEMTSDLRQIAHAVKGAIIINAFDV